MSSGKVAQTQDNTQSADDSHKPIAQLKAEHKAAKQAAQDSQAKE